MPWRGSETKGKGGRRRNRRITPAAVADFEDVGGAGEGSRPDSLHPGGQEVEAEPPVASARSGVDGGGRTSVRKRRRLMVDSVASQRKERGKIRVAARGGKRRVGG